MLRSNLTLILRQLRNIYALLNLTGLVIGFSAFILIFLWVNEEVSLNDYLGGSILIGFRIVSDQGLNYDGFYFDDIQVNTITSTVGVEDQQQIATLLQNIPNPATSQTTIYYNLNNSKNPELKIYNVVGKLIKTEQLAYKSTNTTIDLNSFDNGTYFYQLSGEGYHSSTKKMVVLK